MRSPVVIAIAATLLATGCNTPTYEVKIESVSRLAPDQPKPLSYRIVTRDPEADVAGLRYKEAAMFVKTALSAKGLYEAPTEDGAEMVIEIDYGAVPSRLEIPTEHLTENKGSKDETAGDSSGADRRAITIEEAKYKKHLVIEARRARPNADGRAPDTLWRVSVKNVDENKDLRKYVPVMAAAAMDHIESSTGGEREITVDGKGQAVGFVRKGL